MALVEVLTDEEIKEQDKALMKLQNEGIVDVEKAIDEWNAYQALCRRLLSEDDYQSYKVKVKDENGKWVDKVRRFPKKSAWFKLGRAFNANTRIVSHEELRTKTGRVRESHYIVEASLPNSQRVVQADASCSRSEKGKDKSSDHDIKATAETRATNRALAKLIGAGEVSAEEMSASNRPLSLTEDK